MKMIILTVKTESNWNGNYEHKSPTLIAFVFGAIAIRKTFV